MTHPTFGHSDPRSELASIIQAGLGHPIDELKIADLAAMREHLENEVDRLSDQLMGKEITPEIYLFKLDKLLTEVSKIGEKILGSEDFHKVFGELRTDRLGDAKLFLELYHGGR
jgi:hypothetical protein